jgi:hypothetical protein
VAKIEQWFLFLFAKPSFQASKTHAIDEVLYSTSKPCQPDLTGVDNQVYDMNDPVEFAIKTIRAGQRYRYVVHR